MKTHLIRSGKEGGALLTAMIVIFTTTSLLGTLAVIGLNRVHNTRRLTDRARAQAIAEAGADYAYSVLRTNFALRHVPSAFPEMDYGGGTFDPEIEPVSNAVAIITCTGHCGVASVSVMVDIQNYGIPWTWDKENDPFKYAAVCGGGGMTWGGNGSITITGAPVHANTAFSMNGGGVVNGDVSSSVEIGCSGNCDITGDATAPAWSGKFPDRVQGDAITADVPQVPIPQLDLTPYYNWASEHPGAVIGDVGTIARSTDWVIPGGVLWVNGDFRYAGSGNIIGAIIATGDIIWTGSGSQVKVDSNPSLISRDGNIDIAGNGEFHGLIYAPSGDFEKTGAGQVTGSILVSGSFTKGGNWDMLCYEDSTPVPPDSGTVIGDVIGVAAWQE